MIEFDIHQLFPKFILNDINGFALAKALKAGLIYFLNACETGVNTLLNPDEMPEWRLDEIAWEYNIPFDYTAGIEQKRDWVRRAIPMYRILGTKKAVIQYLEGYFDDVEVEENWNYEGDPFHFRITIDGVWTPETEAWATEAVERVKNVRSVLDDLRIGCRCSIGIIATCGVLSRIKYPFAGELKAGEYPTENIKWEIDNIPGPNIHVDDHDGRVAYDMAGEKPEINHLWKIDNVPGPNIHVEDREGRVAYDIAGEKPEINHLLAIDNIPGPNIHVEDREGTVAYGSAGEDQIAGEKPEINHLLSLDNTPAEGDEAEEIVSTIYYPLCGEPLCGE